MSFANPEALALFFLLIPFLVLAVTNFRRKKQLLHRFVSPTAFGKIGFAAGREIPVFKTLLVTIALAFFILALSGPQWGERYEILEIRGTEMIFLLDTSLSMNAQDLSPSRLEAAKNLVVNVVREFETDFVSLITFAGSAHVQCPLTIDHDAFILMAQAARVSPPQEQGTNLAAAFEFALNAFERKREDHQLIVLISDGEDHSEKMEPLIDELEEREVVVFTVGVGSVQGAPIPLKNEAGEVTGWKKDREGNMVNSRLNDQLLQRIASRSGGMFFRLDDLQGIDYFLQQMQKYGREVINKRTRLTRINRFYYPLILGIIFLIADLLIGERKIKWKRG